jgi:hypothetical protein
MKKFIYILLSCLILTSCYPLSLFIPELEPQKEQFPNYIYLYDDRIYSWIGRPIEELINSWDLTTPLTTEYDGRAINPFEIIDSGEIVYSWYMHGTIEVLESEAIYSIDYPFEEISPAKYRERSFSCDTSALVDITGYIVAIKPSRDFYNDDCRLGTGKGIIGVKRAL